MENEVNAPQDLAAYTIPRPIKAVDPIRGLNERYMSFAGHPYTREQRALDHHNLQTISRGHIDNDNDLAAKLGVDPADRDFQASLERLAVQGCLIRKIFEWHYTGKWVPIENPSFTLTAAGDHMAHEKCPED
jgi:hypothetical protein